MFILIIGGGKVGRSLTNLLRPDHEIMLVESEARKFLLLQDEFEEGVLLGDGSEIYVLETAGIERADLVVAVTGDDEDNIVICQIAKNMFNVSKVIARVNNPRNQAIFEALGIVPTVCATTSILSLIEHELPHKMVHLLNLNRQNLEIVEVKVEEDSPVAGQAVGSLQLPEGALLISVLRNDASTIPHGGTVLLPGDEVLAILEPGLEQALMAQLMSPKA